MNTVFLYALGANIGIAFSLFLFIFFLRNFTKFLTSHIKIFTALTVGVLLSLVFFSFIPELALNIPSDHLGIFLLLGILIFYIFELLFHWHHCSDLSHKNCNHSHEEVHKEHQMLMFFGTLIHNMFHGIVIYSSFAISLNSGIILTLGILFHALPQNIANFIMNKEKINSVLVAAGGGILGVLLCFPFGDFIINNKFYILALTAGGLLYLSLTDILPSIQGNTSVKEKMKYFVFIILGIMIVRLLNVYHNHSDTEDHKLEISEVRAEEHFNK